MHLIMACIGVAILSLGTSIQTLTSFDKKVGLNARPNGLGFQTLSSHTVMTAENSVGDSLVFQLAMGKPLLR